MEKYDNNGKGWYFQFDNAGDYKKSDKYIGKHIHSASGRSWYALLQNRIQHKERGNMTNIQCINVNFWSPKYCLFSV